MTNKLAKLIDECEPHFKWYHTLMFFIGVGLVCATLPTYVMELVR
jgi:hypothetical protein